ncbi:sce7725 family protein [Bacillus altitudinis]|uniref:sce7725 family protein n=1 Tax=Bacillus altitudinis TaxID=293387 RepID=UPI001BD09740|nr:sce7725 family protein [Bacillus altitudinis]MBS4746139.1 sce7725 family protein [Bacillus altitudinis]
MYFPYLRGKQFELLALKELVVNNKISNKVVPVIEPLKPSSTLANTLEVFVENELGVVVISNPSVGNFLLEYQKDDKEGFRTRYEELLDSSSILFGINLGNSEGLDRLNLKKFQDKIVTICTDTESIHLHSELIGSNAYYNLIKDNKEFSREITYNKVMLEDKFNLQKRNADYCKIPDELFSSDHIFYKSEGYLGFADYSITGSDYTEGGFAPYAIAIHIVYFDSNKKLRIKHFTSDSNDDYTDPAGKFYEAISKLVDCPELQNINTDGLNELRACFNKKKYPGLGSVKKMAIKHHLELMNTFLINEEN